MRFVSFPGLSSSGNQALGEHTVLDGLCILITSRSVSWVAVGGLPVGALSQACPVSPLGSLSLAVTLLADVSHPGLQEDLVGNWEPVYSLVEDASLWGQDCPCILALAVAHLPLCLPASGRGMGQSAASWLSFGICPILCSMSRPGCALG